MALADAFDTACVVQKDLQDIYKVSIPIFMLTDSLSLFDVITRAFSMTERRLMIDLTTLTDAYSKKERLNVSDLFEQHLLRPMV